MGRRGHIRLSVGGLPGACVQVILESLPAAAWTRWSYCALARVGASHGLMISELSSQGSKNLRKEVKYIESVSQKVVYSRKYCEIQGRWEHRGELWKQLESNQVEQRLPQNELGGQFFQWLSDMMSVPPLGGFTMWQVTFIWNKNYETTWASSIFVKLNAMDTEITGLKIKDVVWASKRQHFLGSHNSIMDLSIGLHTMK